LAAEPWEVFDNHRSIPTCVGLGTRRVSTTGRNWVHPHVRGAWETAVGSARSGVGPSPRAWGLVVLQAEHVGPHRSIPTCVGLGLPDLHKLSPLPICNQTHRGNPHARGNAITIRGEPHGESHPLRHLRTGTIGNTIYRSRTHKCPLKTNGCPTTATPLEPDRNHHQTPRNRQLLSLHMLGMNSTAAPSCPTASCTLPRSPRNEQRACGTCPELVALAVNFRHFPCVTKTVSVPR